MLKSLVGIASDQGLAILEPERTDTLSLIHRQSNARTEDVAFWAVLEENDARCVQALFVGGLRREALDLLGRTARDIGRILSAEEAEMSRESGPELRAF